MSCYKITATRCNADIVIVCNEAVVALPARTVAVTVPQRSVVVTSVRGYRIEVQGRQQTIPIPVITTGGLKEVFAETPNPANVNYNAINFLPDPLTPDVSDMMFWEP